MNYIEDLGTQLALDVIDAMKETGEDNMVQEIATVLEASSSSMHESFMTAYRVYVAEKRARSILDTKLKAFRVQPTA